MVQEDGGPGLMLKTGLIRVKTPGGGNDIVP